MKLEVLISCMHQDCRKLIERTNIQSDVVVINQCDDNSYQEYTFVNKKGDKCVAKFISTTERGLSKSRNMALKYASADICLICDDDEILDDDYETIISDKYLSNNRLDLAAFKIKNTGKRYPFKEKKINYLSALRLASWQITFNLSSVVSKNITFDETLGSGVSKGGGEENMFLYDCLKNKLRIRYFPLQIGEMINGQSQWFNGCTSEFFEDRGVMTQKLMGKFFSVLYGVYYLVRKYNWYKKDISFFNAAKSLFKGILKQVC